MSVCAFNTLFLSFYSYAWLFGTIPPPQKNWKIASVPCIFVLHAIAWRNCSLFLSLLYIFHKNFHYTSFFSEILAVLGMISAESIVFMCPIEGANYSLNSQHGNISRQGWILFHFLRTDWNEKRETSPVLSFQCITQNILLLLFFYWACIISVLFCKNRNDFENETIFQSWSFYQI